MLNKPALIPMIFGFLLLLAPIFSNAALPGAYMGIQLSGIGIEKTGLSRPELGELIALALHSPNFTVNSFHSGATGFGAGGRIYLGIQGNCFWATEAGYTVSPHAPVHTHATGTSDGLPFTATTSGTLKFDAFDLVVKGIWPLPYHFNLYGKLGGSFIEYRWLPTVDVNHPLGTVTADHDFVDQRIFPTFGLGMSYDFSACFASDLSWSRIQSVGSSHHLGSVDSVSLGLIYYMGKF